MKKKFLLCSLVAACASLGFETFSLSAQERIAENSARVSALDAETTARSPSTSAAKHALDPGIKLAHRCLQHIDGKINDYTATLVRRERIGDKLRVAEYSDVKIRNARKTETGEQVPFSIYMCFKKPTPIEGREVIWVEGQNENRILAHESPKSILGNIMVKLDPDGMIARRDSRYPIYDAGIRNLVVKLIEKGERDKSVGDCEVKFFKGATINGRTCTMMQVTHPTEKPEYDFHIAQIFIDEEMQLPIRYASWDWPEEKKGEKVLLEEYTYLDLKVNVGLTDEDFNPNNESYLYKK
jgi:Protein of unknown function (DUF1571)